MALPHVALGLGEEQLNHLHALLWYSSLITRYLLGVLSALGTVQKDKPTKEKGVPEPPADGWLSFKEGTKITLAV